MKIDNKRLINKYYTALMLYLVFTFADTLLQGLIPQVDSLELWMYTLLGLSLIIQIHWLVTKAVFLQMFTQNVRKRIQHLVNTKTQSTIIHLRFV